jgi:leucyl aminopeptidase
LPLAVRASLHARSGEQALESLLASLLAGEGTPPDLIIVATTADGGAEPACAALGGLLPVTPDQLLAAYEHAGQPGELAESAVIVADQVVRVLFLGLGDRSAAALRRAGAEVSRRHGSGKSVVADLTGLDAEAVAAFAEGVLLGGYEFSLRSEPADDQEQPAADQAGQDQGMVSLLVTDRQACEGPFHLAEVVAGAVATARDLANAPSAGKSPQWLAAEAQRLTAASGVQVRIWPDDELAAAGFGGIVAVGGGSVRPPRLIELSYQPPAAESHIVLVGKGITFDSGGLSLKPNDSMMLMKTDMAGGGAVIAVMAALAELGVRSRVTGLVAAAENMPSGSAYRPGDVLSQYGGTTVEVLNTDAEGRLVLADALAYAAARLAPDQIVDIATLTGAARVALGGSHAALYANCDSLAEALLAAGLVSGDRLWRMPLEDGYLTSLKSPVADIAHVARDHNPAGSILAALFLREFVAGIPWAHLDIAGPGRSATDDGERSKGATGFGTRVLLRWLAPDPAS